MASKPDKPSRSSPRSAQWLATVTTAEAYHQEEDLTEVGARPSLSTLAATLGIVLTAERLVEALPETTEPIAEALTPGELLDPSTLLTDDD